MEKEQYRKQIIEIEKQKKIAKELIDGINDLKFIKKICTILVVHKRSARD